MRGCAKIFRKASSPAILARDVAHDAAKIGLQRFQRTLGAVELFGVRVALLHH
jgi:hypothetical protein